MLYHRRQRNKIEREVEYKIMTIVTCELILVKHFMTELRFTPVEPMKLYCDCILREDKAYSS